MATHHQSPKATTPPKGRPTPPRHLHQTNRRVFGSTARWVAAALLLALAFLVLWMATGGGDLNPLDATLGPQPGSGAVIGVDSQPM
jgi:hypothetical protein